MVMLAFVPLVTLCSVMVPASMPTAARRSMFPEIPESWRAWTKSDDEATYKKWGLEVAIIKRGLDVVRSAAFNGTCACARGPCTSPHTQLHKT